MHESGTCQRRLDVVQVELEGGRDAEVPAGTTDAPEELRVVVRARPYLSAIRGHELYRPQVVDRQAELALQPPDTATEGQAGDTGMADDADRTGQPERLGSVVELGQQGSAVDPGGSLLGVDRRTRHARHVDDDAVVAGRQAGQAVTAAADGDRELLLPPVSDRGLDVGHVRTGVRPAPAGDRSSRSRHVVPSRTRRHLEARPGHGTRHGRRRAGRRQAPSQALEPSWSPTCKRDVGHAGQASDDGTTGGTSAKPRPRRSGDGARN